MANKYDIMAWTDALADAKKRKAACYKRLATWQQRQDDVRCDQTYSQIQYLNEIIDNLTAELAKAQRVEEAAE